MDTAAATWSPHTTVQQTEFQPQSKKLTEPLLQPNERQLAVEDSSGGGGSGAEANASATALNMHDSNTHL